MKMKANTDDEEGQRLLQSGSFSSVKYSGDFSTQATALSDDDETTTGGGLSRAPSFIEFPKWIRPSTRPKPATKPWVSRIDPSALQFAFRMALALTLSSLFVLIKTDSYVFPDGMWVLVSVLFVGWFPNLDAASVMEKIMQRLIGTFVGAVLGLGSGFLSLFFATRTDACIFLGCCMFFINFGIIFFAGQCRVGGVKVIVRFAYATILCVLTFCICSLPFAGDHDPKWEKGVYRVLDVVIGCLLGAVCAILVCPKSTDDVLYEKASRQVRLAGEASAAILNVTADFLSGRAQIHRLADELLDAPTERHMSWKLRSSTSMGSLDSAASVDAADIAMKKYELAIDDWKKCKALFPLTNYDPFNVKLKGDARNAELMRTEVARTLARSLRIQTTVVVLDGMLRNDAEYNFSNDHVDLFRRTAKLLRQMLSQPLDLSTSDHAATKLFAELERIRLYSTEMSVYAATTEDCFAPERERGLVEFKANLLGSANQICLTDRDEAGRSVPTFATDASDNTIFFFQLLEHLVLRCLRLYQAWKNVERLKKN